VQLRLEGIPRFAREVVSEFVADECPTQAAALAYYTIFSIAPLLVIVMVIAGLVLPAETVSAAIDGQSSAMIGREGADQIATMVAHVRSNPGGSMVARALGVVLLLFGATGVMNQLQTALDRAWGVEAGGLAEDGHERRSRDPAAPALKKHRNFLTRRLLSFAMILGIAFLLLVSLVLTTLVSAVSSRALHLIPSGLSEVTLRVLEGGASFVVVATLFAAMFKLLPDVKVEWREVVVGALVTSLLFTIGKELIGLYLGNSALGSAYGAASSLAILLVWVYYSSFILLLGAEFTQVWSRWSR
jgi:membrane protein